MNEDSLLEELAMRDPRYPVEAYKFVRDALAYATDSLQLELQVFEAPRNNGDYDEAPVVERHFTGQQLCEAIRRHAINQYGYLAKVVLRNWNIEATSCFGDLVYNMIDIQLMKKSDQDRREDFDNVYQFNEVFETDLEINASTANL